MQEMVRFADGSLSPIDQFYHELGRAIAEWANIENELGRWFSYFSGMPWDMAIAVFHSARTFRPQSAMFRACLVHSSADSKLIEFFNAALKLAGRYEEFRNSLAHHTVVIWSWDGPRLAPGGKLDDTFSFTREEIEEGYRSFSRLRLLIKEVHYAGTAGSRPLDELLTELRALPVRAVRNGK